MKDFWKKYKMWISIVLYLLLMAALFLFIGKPLLSEIQEKSDEIQKIKIDNQLSQERIAKLPEMRELHETFDQEKNNLTVALDQDNSVDFIKKLELLAQETGNKISLKIDDNSAVLKSDKTSKTKKEKGGSGDIASSLPSDKYLSMEITLEGKYENFLTFLYKLENLDYYVNVLSLSLIKMTPEPFNRDGTSPEDEAVPEESVLISSIRIIVYTK
ncbi:MAG: hypothetical protein A2Z52_02905 [Candidatus Moranbacteria bacterium RBG_19FT_COMBO_42_6]|nr:MAG: hypothetical protein A2Z52_02905 [Candidatus Moranbacteria bacterium RBG_19FT_COMBO_42_6]